MRMQLLTLRRVDAMQQRVERQWRAQRLSEVVSRWAVGVAACLELTLDSTALLLELLLSLQAHSQPPVAVTASLLLQSVQPRSV